MNGGISGTMIANEDPSGTLVVGPDPGGTLVIGAGEGPSGGSTGTVAERGEDFAAALRSNAPAETSG